MKHFCSFSEAIREGAKIRPQAVGTFLVAGKSCALGAGAEAIGFDERSLKVGCFQELAQIYPYLNRAGACPVPECRELDTPIIGRVLTHLNDEHLWTREEIADWLYSYEESIGYVTLVESESSSESLPAAAVLSV